MTCRASRLSSAVITFARDMSGLEDNQVLALNHALMQEGAQTPAPTADQWNAHITSLQNAYTAGILTVRAGSHDPVARLEAARTETPDGPRFYAVERLVTRAQAAAAAQADYFENLGRHLGTTAAHAANEFRVAFVEATGNSRLQAAPAFARSWAANPDNAALPVDRRSLYAFQQTENLRASTLSSAPARPAVDNVWTFPAEPGHGRIVRLASDPATGHTEITWSRDGDSEITHTYRGINEDTLNALLNPTTDTRENTFRALIAGRREYRYDTTDEAAAARAHHRCATCGQFRASSHTCPTIGSDAAIQRDINAATARITGQPEPEHIPALTTRTTWYPLDDNDSALMRLPGISRITAEARANGAVTAAVVAQVEPNALVRGNIRVDYLGRGLGYTATPVGPDQDATALTCSCITALTTGTCSHMTAVTTSVSNLLNARVTTRNDAQAAAATVTSDLTAEYAASVAATTATTSQWREPVVRLADNPDVFQDMYQAAREARTAYEAGTAAFPVEYMRENAFAGMGTRASGRGFGVELEFAFPEDMSSGDRRVALRAIGQELYAAGLTTTQNQQGYGASHGSYRDYHARGWSFEHDPSTGGSDGQSGGEIVSPVMFDEPETWTNLEKVCNTLTRHGAIVSTGSGAHVHVGTGDYDHRVENHNRLLQAFAENTDLLYRLSTDPARGRHRGVGYCRPNTMPSSPYRTVQEANRGQFGHGLGLNLQSVQGRTSDHVEFRTFDATLNPAVIQTQAKIAMFMTEGATRGGSTVPNENATTLGERLNSNPRRGALTGAAWNESTHGFRSFLDRFVPTVTENPADNPHMRQLVALFALTKWQGRRSTPLSRLTEDTATTAA